jgi:hypothetical protein
VTGRLGQAPLVVLEQELPRARVLLDDLQHGPALVGHQLIPLQRAGEQGHGLLHLLDALLAQPSLVESVATKQVLPQRGRRPDAELGAALRVHPVADREDRVEVVVLDLVGLPVCCSCCIFCNNCFSMEFSAIEDPPQMPRDDGLVSAEQRRYLRQRKPYGIAFEPNLEPDATAPVLVDGDRSSSCPPPRRILGFH